MLRRLVLAGLLSGSSLFAADFPRELRDDFEGSRLASFWLPGNYGSGLYAAGAVEVSTNYARGGRQSLRVTVREGEVASPGGDGKMTERADLDSGHFSLLGKEATYSFSVLFPKDFPIVDTRLVFGTCKQSDVARPIVAERFRKGRHTFTIESQGRRKEFALPKITLGSWHDIRYRVRYETNSTGLVEAWFDGKKVVDYRGPTAEAGYKNAFYQKFGLYRDRMKQPMTAYFDDFSMRIESAD
ncbi:MAG TPA: polysaccharide lyase [Verrucomicrobiae bacterium]|nr:polysaccharide lyase [Verrucomicrobiae bacterium]